MDVMEAIYARRAVREFTPEPVDDKVLRQLIDAAVQAPSAVNQQPWSFFVVQDRALLARISREAKAHMLKTSPAGLVSHHFQALLSDPTTPAKLNVRFQELTAELAKACQPQKHHFALKRKDL